jgi:serine/threonine-protein kinase
MGVVYRATQLRLGRQVALKLLAPELAEDEEFRERFLKEASLAASLEHANVVSVYDAGEEGGVLYLAMRYLAGGDLRELLRRQGRLSLERTLQIVDEIAGALDAAHEAGLVHRDVKPANILFSERKEHAYLADFGVARRQSSKGLTQTGSFLGSVDYCAPEQIESALVDGKADVYALGGVCFHCLTGQPPYVRETEVAVLSAHLRDPPPALSRVRPDLPQELDGVLVTAMAKYPQVRYATAGAFAQALQDAIASPRAQATVIDVAPLAPPREQETEALVQAKATMVAPSAPSRRRRRRVSLGIVASVLLLAAAVGIGVVALRGSDGKGGAQTMPEKPLSAVMAPHMRKIAGVQQAINEQLPHLGSDEESFVALGNSASKLLTSIVRAQGFLGGAPNRATRDPAVRKALAATLSEHLRYSRALASFSQRPRDRKRAQIAITRAAASERSYGRLARIAASLPRVPLQRQDHLNLPTAAPPVQPKVVRFASVDRLQHCEATSTLVRCGSGPSGQVVQLRVGGPAVYLGRLGSVDRGGPALRFGAVVQSPGGAFRCNSSYRGITCVDKASEASFVIGDFKHFLTNPGSPAGSTQSGSPVGVPSTYTGYFTSVDRLQHCYATDSDVRCGSGPSGQFVELRAGIGATYVGVSSSSDNGGPSMPMGTSFRTPARSIECGSSSRGITCVDLAGSGESFTIGDHYVNVNGVTTRR